MDKLFVIGNGFDCYVHNLPTKYSDFRKYLIEKYNVNGEDVCVPSSKETYDGWCFDDSEVVNFICYVLDGCDEGDWNNLESYLGDTIFEAFYYEIPQIDYDDDKYLFKSAYASEDTSNDIKYVFSQLKKYFYDWVNDELINVKTNGKKCVSSVLGSGQHYLSFNYTKILEEVYGIENVCHIHGVVGDDIQDIFFGHGDDSDVSSAISNVASFDNLNMLKRTLRKDTYKALDKNRSFFKSLKNVNKIYSSGFSFSQVDLDYVQAISENVAPNCVWYLNGFDYRDCMKGKKNYIELLESYGFTVKREWRW